MFNLTAHARAPLYFELEQHDTTQRDRFTVLIGANGTGKSQVLRSLAQEFIKPESSPSDTAAPRRTVAISNLVSDVFPFGSSRPDSGYRYLGLRQAANNMSTGSLHDSIISHLVEFGSRRDGLTAVTAALREVGISDWLIEIDQKKSRRRPASVSELRSELDRVGIERPESVVRDIYDSLSRLSSSALDPQQSHAFVTSLVSETSSTYDLEMSFLIRLIRKALGAFLDVRFKLGPEWRSTRSLSAGQSMLVATIARIAATVENDSLILIDEPETGLHPNWQSSFIPIVRSIIPRGSGSHFFIASHSPFLVGDATDVLVPSGAWGRFESFDDPFAGRSVENILYRVFNARVVGNSMVEADLTQVISALSSPGNQENFSAEANQALYRLERVASTDTPSLNRVLSEARHRRTEASQ